MTHLLVLVRHGESEWNKLNLFTGWKDPDLTEKGVEEATRAGKLLKAAGYKFDIAYTSVLTRAQHTLKIMLSELGQTGLEPIRDQRLNERDYGDLSGLNKDDARKKWGEEQVLIWRRSYDIPPPPLKPDDPRNPGKDPRYASLKPEELPLTECLKDTVARFMPYWGETIAPALREGKRVLVAAHGNSLRALVKYLDDISDEEIVGLNIPTGIPLVYELDEDLKPIRHFYLGDPEAVKKATEAVAGQLKKKS